MNQDKDKPNLCKISVQKPSYQSVYYKEEDFSTKYLSLIEKNSNLSKLMSKFINDPTSKMNSVTESYIHQCTMAQKPFNNSKSHISKKLHKEKTPFLISI